MTQYAFTEASFNQALARTRAAEAAELAAAAAGNGPKPSRDIGEVLRQQAQDHQQKVLSQWFGA